MKTNIDKIFKNDETLEKSGIWFEIKSGVGFLIKRFGGMNSPAIKLELARHYKPYARQIENGTLDDAKEKEISMKVFINSCVVDWKGIEVDGSEVPFSKEKCLELFTSLPELAETLLNYATDTKNFREDLGNS